jgi:nucleotide-binding universal stress UspA family protein
VYSLGPKVTPPRCFHKVRTAPVVPRLLNDRQGGNMVPCPRWDEANECTQEILERSEHWPARRYCDGRGGSAGASRPCPGRFTATSSGTDSRQQTVVECGGVREHRRAPGVFCIWPAASVKDETRDETERPQPEIIVGVDGSEASIEALRQGQWLAFVLNARLVAMACWEYPPVYAGYVALGIEGFEAGARKILESAVETAFGSKVPETVEVRLVRGTPKKRLVEASRGALMLVVGRQGNSAVAGLLLGSVSSACAAHAHCPVLVVHPADRERQQRTSTDVRPADPPGL